ncbi:hypothetical protein KBB96_12855 [Luteolibacter ambystomatis]|uniref:Lipoprotein n=1 Tax=Luteolibacter ambystomatis TaxID=2824561 RepID=A0A975G5L5_9BACT|nr:hypothetical protein [Luteolibacter ambystomatis]QUE49759.1 hypothetical protein KBB96_12855 [Luteolibacter ambystomatis]
MRDFALAALLPLFALLSSCKRETVATVVVSVYDVPDAGRLSDADRNELLNLTQAPRSGSGAHLMMISRFPVGKGLTLMCDQGLPDGSNELDTRFRCWVEPMGGGQCRVLPEFEVKTADGKSLSLDKGEAALSAGGRVLVVLNPRTVAAFGLKP